MIDKKVIILVMCSTAKHYKQLENCIKETWFNYRNDDVEIIFYSDNVWSEIKSGYPVLDVNNLILPCDDGVQNCGIKTLLAFDWVSKNYNYEYIYRSNLGAYVDVEKLLRFLSDKPKDKFYCGIMGTDNFYLNRPVSFVSGSGYFLSKDLVNLVLDNSSLWNHKAVDDVALGDLLQKLNINISASARRVNICSGKIDYNIGSLFVDTIPNNDIYHIRLRSDNREEDIRNMKMLYEKKYIDMYELKCNTTSDINEHLPVLKKYAEQCESVTEMGVRCAVSTWAFIEAKPKKLTCYDIMYEFFKPSEYLVKQKCQEYGIEFKFIEGDSLKINLEPVDMLFIDTLHTYNQLYSELNRHSINVKKWIALHDTTTFGQRDEGIYDHASDLIKDKNVQKQGLMNAVLDFLAENKNWQLKESFTNNNGLTIIEKINI